MTIEYFSMASPPRSICGVHQGLGFAGSWEKGFTVNILNTPSVASDAALSDSIVFTLPMYHALINEPLQTPKTPGFVNKKQTSKHYHPIVLCFFA